MKRPAKLRTHWIPPLIWATILFALSSGPGPEIPIDVKHIDKIQHAGAFAVLGGLVSRAVAFGVPALGAGKRVVVSGVAATLYGVSDEIHQRYVPRRSPDVLDVVADATGGFLGALAHTAWRRRRGSGVEAPDERQNAR